MSGAGIMILEAVVPMVILIVHGRIKIVRARRKAADADPVPAPPFEPTPESVPGFFLRLFPMSQRAYLRQQIKLGKAVYYIATYILVAMFTTGLWPQFVDGYRLEYPFARGVWHSYLDHLAMGEVALGIIMFLGAMIVSSGLTTGAPATFNRTRPLTYRFLFWARTLSALATVLASLATAAAVSFVLLLVFYGPVWRHLAGSAQPIAFMMDQPGTHLIALLQTSAPRVFLSLVTTTFLIFSGFLFVLAPFPRFLGKRFGQFIFWMVGVFTALMILHMQGFSDSLFARVFFLDTGLGSSPSYAYAFVPILTSALLLFLAQLLIRRVEP